MTAAGGLLSDWAAAGWLGYLAVAIGAAIPWLEIVVVIPPAIILDLDPVMVGVAAFVGNFLPVAVIVLAYDRLARWRRARRGEARESREAGGEAGPEAGRGARGRRILQRYGVPGLALLGPLITGIHLAAVLAMTTGATREQVLGWSGASLALWTVALTVASVSGLRLLTG